MDTAQFQLHAKLEDQHWWFVARRRILASLARTVVPPGPDSVVVDVGCGTGANLAALADGCRGIGIDTSDEAIQLARRRFPREQFRRLEFIAGMAPDDLGHWMAAADLVLLTDVLEHVPDDFEMFTSLLAAASPGAHFLITVPANESLWSVHDESFGHYRRYTRERFARLWVDQPVRPLLVSHYNTRLYPLISLVRRWNQRCGQAAGAAATDFKLPPSPLNKALARLFAGEAGRLHGALNCGESGYSNGVSLIALVRREEGPVTVQSRPTDVEADLHDPATNRRKLAHA